ncbi:hypothetical protein IC794_01160 [Acinetobacter seifertii]|uniref:retron St85 family effector protein n=1 Tax=Acinetobacter seifertii TaxID=1530123 RepID=UPI00168B4F89|nr:retron St85 family effector protein [Acinetobacter seifertii]QNX12503.1 hypothetical protein IC794_01160 [Acinetobacter seifertii]QNX79833.1 hypothetical protein IC775_18600 [Acinetobacter seifertii]QNX94996.1 hypothetical protein IC771_18560 [Acinetobacter seifertii]
MKYEEILLEEVIKWDTEKFNLIFKNPIIFLCGGEIEPTEEAGTKFYSSLRSYLIDFAKLIKNEIEIRTAENFKDYLLAYDNLLEFESDIASISDLVVIILESPGALIELGIFVEHKNIRHKLIAIQHQNHSAQLSFINLGPLKFLKDLSEKSVLDYNWPMEEKFQHLDHELLKLICNDIVDHLKSPRTQSNFDIKVKSHLILFIYEVIRCFYPITDKEILSVLHLLYDHKVVNMSKLKKVIYLLDKFDLISGYKLSSDTFFTLWTLILQKLS